MTEVDFIIAIALTLGILSFAIFHTVTVLSDQLNYAQVLELKQASLSLQKQIQNNLYTDFNKIQATLRESGGYEHTEKIVISLKPGGLKKIHVYDKFLNEIESIVIKQSGRIVITFNLDFLAFESKEILIFYVGPPTNEIRFLEGNDISPSILSEKSELVISQVECLKIKSKNYETIKEELGFEHHFNIDITSCDFGLEPPEANVIVTKIPLLVENPDEIIFAELSKISVW